MTRHSERHWFVNDQHLRLAAIIEKPVEASRGTLLLSHCFTCSKDLKSIVRLARRLTDFGWTTCRFDFRGIGQSEGEFAESNFATNLADLQAVCRGLRQLGQQVDFLFGHSFGGAASMLAAAENGGLEMPALRGVIVLAAPSDTVHLADILVAKQPEIETKGEGLVEIGGKQFLIRKQMLVNFRKTNYRERLLTARHRANFPHLVIHSLVDQTVAYSHALTICDLLRQAASAEKPADVSLHTLADSDHLLSRDPQDVEIVAALIHAWCRQRVTGTRSS